MPFRRYMSHIKHEVLYVYVNAKVREKESNICLDWQNLSHA
jgi:hypothetical protein